MEMKKKEDKWEEETENIKDKQASLVFAFFYLSSLFDMRAFMCICLDLKRQWIPLSNQHYTVITVNGFFCWWWHQTEISFPLCGLMCSICCILFEKALRNKMLS